MIRLTILALLLWIVPATASEMDSQLSDDVAFTKAAISLLAAKDFTGVRDRLDAAMGQAADDKLNQMSNLFGAGAPVSIETVSVTGKRNLQTGASNSRMLLEYAVTGKWLVVDAVVNTQAGSQRLTRLFITNNAQSLRELNAFHLFGKGATQYLFLAGWLAVIALTALAMVIAFKGHTGWRRWVLIASMPLGLTPGVAVNWNTAQIWVVEAASNGAEQYIPIFAVGYPMALFGFTELHAVYLSVSAPLIAFGYLARHWWLGRRPLAPPASGELTAG